MLTSAFSVLGLVIGAAVFVVLFVVLSVPLWVSIVAGVAALLITGAIGGGADATRHHGAPSH